jgi:hypothetical protein
MELTQVRGFSLQILFDPTYVQMLRVVRRPLFVLISEVSRWVRENRTICFRVHFYVLPFFVKRNVKIERAPQRKRRCKHKIASEREKETEVSCCPSYHNPANSHSLHLPPQSIIITMEVASPLPFGHSAAGNKRQFPGSPGLVDSTNRSPFTMHNMESDEYVNPRLFKRRRFTADDTMTDSDSATVQASFPSSAVQQKNSFFGASSGESIVIVPLFL